MRISHSNLPFLALRTSRMARFGTRFSYELHHFSGDSEFGFL